MPAQSDHQALLLSLARRPGTVAALRRRLSGQVASPTRSSVDRSLLYWADAGAIAVPPAASRRSRRQLERLAAGLTPRPAPPIVYRLSTTGRALVRLARLHATARQACRRQDPHGTIRAIDQMLAVCVAQIQGRCPRTPG
jgi:hypothetical protein